MKKTLGVVLVLALALSCRAQSGLSTFITDSLDSYVTRGMAQWQIPGVAVCIVKDGKAVVMKGYGVREMGSRSPVDENTLFMIGSNTKAFTATALAMLATDKKLSLDDHVQKWYPSFKLYDPWVAKEANLRDLLCHRLGFETFQGDFMYFDSDLTTPQVLEKLAKVKPAYSFRSRWGYTNASFAVAGEVIRAASGKSWADFLSERIFTPLGMSNTLALSRDMPASANKASAHTVVDGKLRKIPFGRIDNMAPAGSISSSVSDMSKWVMALLAGGRSNGTQVIPGSAINATWTPHSILGNGGPSFNTGHFALYGLGWFLEEYNGKKIVSHTGGVNGFVTAVTLVPEEKLGVIVLTNTDMNNFFESLKQEIVDACLGLPYRNYHQSAWTAQQLDNAEREKQMKLKKDTIASKPATALTPGAYTGNYEHEVYGRMSIELKGGKLVANFEHHKGRLAELAPLGGSRFLATFNDPMYGVKVWPFEVADGKVKSVRVRVADFVEFLPYEFRKLD